MAGIVVSMFLDKWLLDKGFWWFYQVSTIEIIVILQEMSFNLGAIYKEIVGKTCQIV